VTKVLAEEDDIFLDQLAVLLPRLTIIARRL